MHAAAQLERLSGWIQRRDPRHKVLIRARMRAGGMPVDVCIRDVSARGLCVVSSAPPVRGTIVELTGSYGPIVGRVVWTNELRFGIEVRGRIDVGSIVASRQGHKDVLGSPLAVAAPPAVTRIPDVSRFAGNAMQFAFLAFLAGCAATFIGQTVYENLAGTTAAIVAGLDRAG